MNFGFAGQVGVTPRRVQMVVTDSAATLTTANYLNQNGILPNTVYKTDIFDIIYSYNTATQAGTYAQFLPSIAASTGIITLSLDVSEGNVVLPVIADHMAAFSGTTGLIKSDASTIINSGNVQAGLSGTAGYLASFPSTAAKGSLRVTGVANTGDTLVTISNALHSQASVYSIPDSGSATATFAVCAAALVNGNAVKASGTAGKLVDAGYALTNSGTTVINAGDIQAGLSGTAGKFASFPTTAAKGSLLLKAVDNTGDTLTTISNAAMGQASVISIPDPAAATANFALAPSALVSGNAVKASGTAGLLVDAAYALKANTTAAYAGGGTSNAFVATGLTATSIVTAVILASTNDVSIAKAVPTADTLTVTFSADPGAATTVSWIAISAAV